MIRRIFLVCAFFFFITTYVHAEIVLKIRAINPLDKPSVAQINYPLSKEIIPEDIIDHKIIFGSKRSEEDILDQGEFQVLLNVDDGLYYIKQDIELLPKEVVTFEVKVRDVWVIDKSNIDVLVRQLKEISEEIEQDPLKQTNVIMSLKGEISDAIDNIIRKQDLNLVKNVGIEKHIEAYRQNVFDLEQVFLDIAMLKNLVNDTQKEKRKKEKK